MSIWTAILLTGLVWFGLRAFAPVAVYLRAFAQGLSFTDAADRVQTDPITLAALQAAVIGAVLALGVRGLPRETPLREALRVRPLPLRALALSLLGGAAMQLPLAELANLVAERFPVPIELQLIHRQLVTPDGWVEGAGAVLAFVLVAPVAEELLFRGLLLPGLTPRYGRWFAIAATAGLFGSVHLDRGLLSAAVPALVAGLVFGVMAAKTRSVLPTIAAHAGNNALVLLLPERLVRVEGLNTLSERVYHLDPWLLTGGTALAVACLGWVVLGAKETE
jgi:membrane protease YdiL (CAAX protease family)